MPRKKQTSEQNRIYSQRYRNKHPENWKESYLRYHCTLKGMAILLVGRAKYRANRDGRSFDITIEHVQNLLELAVMAGDVTLEKNRPETASLDCEKPEFGYVMNNVNVVPWWYNAAKARFTSSVIQEAILRWASSHGNYRRLPNES